jgi:hypothetical protein
MKSICYLAFFLALNLNADIMPEYKSLTISYEGSLFETWDFVIDEVVKRSIVHFEHWRMGSETVLCIEPNNSDLRHFIVQSRRLAGNAKEAARFEWYTESCADLHW